MKDKDGKEEKKELNICLTHHERLDGNTGMVLVSAAVRQVEGQDKQHFMVMVPLGMMLQAGMRATLYPKDAWEKVQKNEQVDESKLKAIKLTYTLCHPAGCTAEMEATPELLNDLKTGGGLVVFAINADGAPVGFPVPLTGFDQSLAGAPVDNKQYGEARRALMQQIAARQQELIEQQKAEAQKGAPAAAPAARRRPLRRRSRRRRPQALPRLALPRVVRRPFEKSGGLLAFTGSSKTQRIRRRQCGCCRNSGR